MMEENFELLEKVTNEYPNITERKSIVGISGVTPRTLYHWKEQGLVDIDENSSGTKNWTRINIYEYIWLRILLAARNFGVTFDALKELKNESESNIIEMLKDPVYIEIIRQSFENGEEMVKRIKPFLIKNKDILDDPEPEDKHLFTLLGSVVNKILFAKENYLLIIFKNEKNYRFMYTSISELESLKPNAIPELTQPHINIPLQPFIEEFIGNPKNDANLEIWGFIDRNEKKVIKALRNKDFDEIIIKKNNENKNFTIEASMNKDVYEEKAKEIRKILGLNHYSEVVIKYRNDKHLFIKNKQKL